MSTIPVAQTAPIAPLSRRAVACLIDLAVGWILVIAGNAITASVALSSTSPSALLSAALIGVSATGAVVLAWFLVFCLLQGRGASVGMRLMKLRLVRADTGAPLGFGRALLRTVVFGLSASIVVGYFTPLFDGSGRSQGWHDRAAGALVRDVRRGVPAVPATVPAAVPAPAVFPEAATTTLSASRQGPADDRVATGHTAPAAPGAAGVAESVPRSIPRAAPVLVPDRVVVPDPAADPEDAMITTVPGISPSVRAPASTAVSGPEAAVPAPTVVAAAAAPVAAAPIAPVVPPRAPAPVAPAPSAPDPIAPPVEDTDDDLAETRISIPGHRLLFVWDDGARATVSGRTLFGRNPAPEQGASVVVVRDETLSLSKTHFEAAAEAAGGWVMDRRSTNGTTVVRDGVRIACPPGERVRIRLGDAIEIGDRIVTVGGYA